MGIRSHMHTKHVIEFGGSEADGISGWHTDSLANFLRECGVYISSVYNSDIEDWEIYKKSLSSVTEEAIQKRFPDESADGRRLTRREVRQFVKACMESVADPDYCYISWF